MPRTGEGVLYPRSGRRGVARLCGARRPAAPVPNDRRRGEWYACDGLNIILRSDRNGTVSNRYLHGPQVDQVFADESTADGLLWALADNQEICGKSAVRGATQDPQACRLTTTPEIENAAATWAIKSIVE